MAIFDDFVNVFICQVDAPGKACVTVYHGDFPVIPVVHPQRQDRHQGIEHTALDSHGFHLMVIVPGQGEQASHIVINQPHIHSLGRLFFQDFQNLVPHNTFFDDEILHENEPLRFFQFIKQTLKFQFTDGQVRPKLLPVRRVSPIAGNIPGLDGGFFLAFLHFLQAFKNLRFIGCHGISNSGLINFHTHCLPATHFASSQKQIEKPAENGEKHDGNDPGNFIGRVDSAVHHPQKCRQTQQQAEAVKEGKVLIKP